MTPLSTGWTGKFFYIAKDGNPPITSEALERVACAIEESIRGHSVDVRRALRQERSLRSWSRSIAAPSVTPWRHWNELTRFRDRAQSQKNAFFAGDDGRRTGILTTFDPICSA